MHGWFCDSFAVQVLRLVSKSTSSSGRNRKVCLSPAFQNVSVHFTLMCVVCMCVWRGVMSACVLLFGRRIRLCWTESDIPS